MKKSLLRRTLEGVGWVIVLYLCYEILGDILRRSSMMMAVLADSSFVEPQPVSFDGRYNVHPVWTLLHTAPAFFFTLLGPLQFVSAIRMRFPSFHRVSGRIYLVSSLLLAVAAFAITLVFPVWGDRLPMKSASLAASAFLAFAVIKAFYHARRREFHFHREWMIRGFAVGLGVATFRVINSWLMAHTDMSFTEVWNSTGWMSFSINLLVAEIWINVTRPRALLPRRSEA